MTVKYIAIIVDDFTNRVLDYPNVTYYDYGIEQNITYTDNYWVDWFVDQDSYVGLGTFDNVVTNWENKSYYHSSQFYDPFITDQTTQGPFWSGYNYTYLMYQYEYYSNVTTLQSLTEYASSENAYAKHGDWVIDAFFDQLDDPNSVEVVAVDIDFTKFEDFTNFFSPVSSAYPDVPV